MNPNHPNYPKYPQSSGAARMTTSYQAAGPAAPAGIGPGPRQARGASQQQIQYPKLDRLAELTDLTPVIIRRIIQLRETRDPDHQGRRALDFYQIHLILQSEFGSEMKFDSDGLESSWWNHIRHTLPRDFQAKHSLPAETIAVLAQGSQEPVQPGSVDPQAPRRDAYRSPRGSFQNLNVSSYGTPALIPGASYGGSQTGQGGSRREPQFGHGGPFVAPRLGPGASSGGSLSNYRSQYTGYQPGSHGAPPRRPPFGHAGQYGAPHSSSGGPYPMPNQNYDSTPQGPVPGMREPMNGYHPGGRGSNSQAPHGGFGAHHPQPPRAKSQSTGELLSPQEDWILSHAVEIDHVNYTEDDFVQEHAMVWGSRPSGPQSLWTELDQLRNRQARQ